MPGNVKKVKLKLPNKGTTLAPNEKLRNLRYTRLARIRTESTLAKGLSKSPYGKKLLIKLMGSEKGLGILDSILGAQLITQGIKTPKGRSVLLKLVSTDKGIEVLNYFTLVRAGPKIFEELLSTTNGTHALMLGNMSILRTIRRKKTPSKRKITKGKNTEPHYMDTMEMSENYGF